MLYRLIDIDSIPFSKDFIDKHIIKSLDRFFESTDYREFSSMLNDEQFGVNDIADEDYMFLFIRVDERFNPYMGNVIVISFVDLIKG